jgi:hypothetical protein
LQILWCLRVQARAFSHHGGAVKTLKERLQEQAPEYRAKLKHIKESYGKEILGTCTVEQAIGGMRSVKSMLYETSLLDAEEVRLIRNVFCIGRL